MKKRIYVLLYAVATVLLLHYYAFFRVYAEKLIHSKVGMFGVIFAFLSFLLGFIEILCWEFAKLYSLEYYCCFKGYNGLRFAIKSRYPFILIMQFLLLLFGEFLQISLVLLFFLSFLVAITFFSVVYFVEKRSIWSDKRLSLTRFGFNKMASNIIWDGVLIKEMRGRVNVLDAMAVRLLVSFIFAFLSKTFVKKRELYCLLVICLLLISICGERYIKNSVQTLTYLFHTTKRGKKILWRSLWIDCVLNNFPLFLLALFTPLAISGAVLSVLLGCFLTIYWDIFFMWLYKGRYSVGVVATLEFMALIILFVPIANVFFCYITYRKVLKRNEMLA